MVMERINPPMIKAWMLRDGTVIEIDSLSELGIYSCLFMDSDKKDKDGMVIVNEKFGTLMRTKGSHSNEGGVNTGYAVIDQPVLYLCDDKIVGEKITENVTTLMD